MCLRLENLRKISWYYKICAYKLVYCTKKYKKFYPLKYISEIWLSSNVTTNTFIYCETFQMYWDSSLHDHSHYANIRPCIFVLSYSSLTTASDFVINKTYIVLCLFDMFFIKKSYDWREFHIWQFLYLLLTNNICLPTKYKLQEKKYIPY